ncbi:MAG: hypothetical protein JW884_13305, partial [Deltaproteobacteria bacterium]|nr:hypothetical protein [Deltaproteobacteria bacterium]
IVESFPPEALRNLWNDRLKIRTKECAFREFLAREGLTVSADRLHYFSHWITPEILPIRFDVRFFAAKAPRGQEALHDGAETTKSLWISPANALRRHDEGSFPMVLPTVVVLEELAEFRSVDEVVESTAGKSICGILTRIVVDDRDGVVEYFPDGTARRRCHPSMDLRTMPGYERSVVVARSRETES